MVTKASRNKLYREGCRRKCQEAGMRLKLWRVAHKLTQTKLAEKLGMSQATICLWELGEANINYDRIKRLCPEMLEAFGEDMPW